PLNTIPFTAGAVVTLQPPAVVTFTFRVTVFAPVRAVPTVYVPAMVGVQHAPGAPFKVKTAAEPTVIVKLQLELPAVTGICVAPPVAGVPLPVSTIVCAPVARVPVPEKVIPFVSVVDTLYVPAVVTLTFNVTVFVAFNG